MSSAATHAPQIDALLRHLAFQGGRLGVEHGDLAVQEDTSGRLLPTAIFARWSNPR